MAVSGKIYGNVMKICFGGISGKSIDWTSDTIKIALLTGSYTPSQAHLVWSEVSANEIPATGNYVAGGMAINSGALTVYLDTSTGTVSLDVAVGTTVWEDATIATTRYAVIYDTSVVNGGSSPYLIGYIDFGEAKSSSASDFTILWTDNGRGSFTVLSAAAAA